MVAAVILLLIVTAATFAVFFVVPRLAGATPEDLASRYVGRNAAPEVIREIAEKLGFTDPIWVQYGRFVTGLVLGADYNTGPTTVHCPAPCFGYSFLTQNPVLPDLINRLPVTMSLAAGAALIWLIAGVSTGVVSALRRGSVVDRAAMGVALAGVSLPIFFTGLLALSIFSYGLGITAPGGSYVPIAENPLRWAYNLILTIFGLDLGLLLGGAILTESTYSLPGIGKYSVDAVVNNDLPKVLGVVLVGSIFIIVANLVVDLLYAVVDPRVRY